MIHIKRYPGAAKLDLAGVQLGELTCIRPTMCTYWLLECAQGHKLIKPRPTLRAMVKRGAKLVCEECAAMAGRSAAE